MSQTTDEDLDAAPATTVLLPRTSPGRPGRGIWAAKSRPVVFPAIGSQSFEGLGHDVVEPAALWTRPCGICQFPLYPTCELPLMLLP
jgi:hypothetical protein